MKLYQFEKSGNCYKIRLLLSQLQKEYIIENLPRNFSKLSNEFLNKSPLGKVPFLEINDLVFTESMAILYYLSKDTFLFPKEFSSQVEIIKWLSFEQSEIQTSIARNRFLFKFKNIRENKSIKRAKKALNILNLHLENKKFLVANTYTIADISLYAYVHLSSEIDISLENYPNIILWLKNVENQANYIKI